MVLHTEDTRGIAAAQATSADSFERTLSALLFNCSPTLFAQVEQLGAVCPDEPHKRTFSLTRYALGCRSPSPVLPA
jgi:hypothetical protein